MARPDCLIYVGKGSDKFYTAFFKLSATPRSAPEVLLLDLLEQLELSGLELLVALLPLHENRLYPQLQEKLASSAAQGVSRNALPFQTCQLEVPGHPVANLAGGKAGKKSPFQRGVF